MHYIYRHIRLDKNEPFYIGIGTKLGKETNSFKNEYYRAFSKQRLDSKIWNLITSKSDYEVEILMESKDYNFIKEKEKEFIKLYGRIDNKTGILANMTDGGDGTLGLFPSDETKKKLKIARSKRIFLGKKIYQYDLKGNFIREWDNISKLANKLGLHRSTLCKVSLGKINNGLSKGSYWSRVPNFKIN